MNAVIAKKQRKGKIPFILNGFLKLRPRCILKYLWLIAICTWVVFAGGHSHIAIYALSLFHPFMFHSTIYCLILCTREHWQKNKIFLFFFLNPSKDSVNTSHMQNTSICSTSPTFCFRKGTSKLQRSKIPHSHHALYFFPSFIHI